MTEYKPCRRAAWDARFEAFALDQVVDVLPARDGRATRLRLTIEPHAKAPLNLLLPLLGGRFRRTMTRSLATIDSLMGVDDR